jgi:RNA-directed DNA polymerase
VQITESGKVGVAPQTTKLSRSDDDLRSAFLSIKTPKDVANLLEVPLGTLTFYVFRKKNYGEFLLRRACGRPRVISAPVTPLKIIQRKLAQVLYAVYGSRSVVHGFARGRSIKSNAARHFGAEWVLNFDLKDFFPTIHFGRVLGLFAGRPYNLSRDVSVLLARICCHNGALPIGAPTSPITANMICAKMDSELKALAWSCGCVYTRYADDVSISTKSIVLDKRIADKNLTKREWEISAELLEIIRRNSFEVNPAKTRVRGSQSSQEITGVRINSRLNVSRMLLRQVRSMLHAWEKFGEDAAQNEYRSKYERKQHVRASPAFRAVLRGKIEFIGFIRGRDDRLYVGLLQRLQKLAGLHAKPIIIGPSTHESVIRQGIWLLRDKKKEYQGTAFAVEGNLLLTAAHNTDNFLWASRPNYDSGLYPVTLVKRNDELDIALIEIPSFLPVQFEFACSNAITLMKSICVAGFPNYHDGDSVAFRLGKIVQERYYVSTQQADPSKLIHVKHYIVDADIVKGNSGGPVLGEDNRVIGIAVKGLDAPGSLGKNDQLSSFVPVEASSL